MEEGLNIFNSTEYHVNKGFHRQVEGPSSYIIKVVGIDGGPTSTRETKTKVSKDQGAIKPNEKYSSIVIAFFLIKTLRRRRIRNEIKKRRYEELEQTV